MTTVFFHSDLDDPHAWQASLTSSLPEIKFVIGPRCDAPENVDVVLAWTPPPQGFKVFPNLRAVLSLGAGVDQLQLSELDLNVPVARLIDNTLTQRMVEYCQAAVFFFHRHFHLHAGHQSQNCWVFIPPVSAAARHILVLGLGELGSAVAVALAGQGFQVSGWSRNVKQVPGVNCLQGEDPLTEALGRCDVVINLLPLTPQTSGLLNELFFSRLRPEACLVQVGRGGHLVESDLLRALECGGLAGAFLDVFHEEPVPADHPFWRHPLIRVTPHVASLSDPIQASSTVIENIGRAMRGKPLLHAIDRQAGY